MLHFVKRWGTRLPALVAVSTLGVAVAAVQALDCPAGVCARFARSVAGAEGPSPRSVYEVPGRFQEIKVALAWLADSTTYPWALSAHATGPYLILRGEVPSEAVRQHAVCLARQATTLPVLDTLRVRSDLPPAPSGAAPDEVLRGVMNLLREVLGERARWIEVGMRAGGQVTLHGAVTSYEEKLAISSRMRGVSGCACVINELTVPATVSEGRTVLPISADGSKIVTLSSSPSQAAEAAYRPAPWSAASSRSQAPRPIPGQGRSLISATSPPPRPLPVLSASVGSVPPAPYKSSAKSPVLSKSANTQGMGAGVVPVAHSDGMSEPRPEKNISPASNPSAPSASMGPPASSTWATRASHLPSKPMNGFAQDPRAAAKKESEEKETPPEQRDPPDLAWPRVEHAEAVPPPWKRSGAKSSPPAAAPLKAPSKNPMLPPSLPANKPVPSSKPLQKMPERGMHAPSMAQTRSVPATKDRSSAHPTLFSGLFGKKKESRPASSAKGSSESTATLSMHAVPMGPRVTAAPTSKGAVADRPYVTTGVVTLEEEPSEPPAPSPPKPAAAPAGPEPVAATPAELQQRVLRVCGGTTRDVQVTTRPDRHWEVKVKVATMAAASEVERKILQGLPDMVQPHVHLAVEVTP